MIKAIVELLQLLQPQFIVQGMLTHSLYFFMIVGFTYFIVFVGVSILINQGLFAVLNIKNKLFVFELISSPR
jgi:hypothetical protein